MPHISGFRSPLAAFQSEIYWKVEFTAGLRMPVEMQGISGIYSGHHR
jgi:hypothetical protein